MRAAAARADGSLRASVGELQQQQQQQQSLQPQR